MSMENAIDGCVPIYLNSESTNYIEYTTLHKSFFFRAGA